MKKRVISYLLILTALLSVFCLPITAENTNETDIAASSLQNTSVADSKDVSLPEGATIVEEVKEKRGKFEKHWNMVSSVLISDEFTIPNSLYNWVDNRADSIDNLPLISAYNYVGYYDGNQLKEYQWYN